MVSSLPGEHTWDAILIGRIVRSVGTGVVIGLAGLVAVSLFFGLLFLISHVFGVKQPKSETVSNSYFVIAAFGIGAILAAIPTWFFIAEKTLTPNRGMIAGAVGGVLAHPLCWFFILYNESKLSELLILPFLVSIMSLIVAGWITVPAMAMTAGWLAKRRTLSLCLSAAVPPSTGDGIESKPEA